MHFFNIGYKTFKNFIIYAIFFHYFLLNKRIL